MIYTAHAHSIYDGDQHFVIDPVSRAIANVSMQKTTLMQYDHNSERFTFELPRYIEGHDMSECNAVQVHYLNVSTNAGSQAAGVYPVTDVQVSPDDENIVICSWLISANATQLVGSLNFLVKFACITNEIIDYAWNTAIFTGILVSTGMNNGEVVIETYGDVLMRWKAELDAAKIIDMTQTEVGSEDGSINTWTATFGNGQTSTLQVRNGSRGPEGKSAYDTAKEAGFEGTEYEFTRRMLGVPIAITTTSGDILRFFIGTQAQYNALEYKDPYTIYYITDDATLTDLERTFQNAISKLENDLTSGTTAVGRAACDLHNVSILNYIRDIKFTETATGETRITVYRGSGDAFTINKISIGESVEHAATADRAYGADMADALKAEAGTGDQDRRVYFGLADTPNGEARIAYDDDFTYNPYTNILKVPNIESRGISDTYATKAYARNLEQKLSQGNFKVGSAIAADMADIAVNATNDGNGDVITDTYLKKTEGVQKLEKTISVTFDTWKDIGTMPEGKTIDDIMLVGAVEFDGNNLIYKQGVPYNKAACVTGAFFTASGKIDYALKVNFQVASGNLQIKATESACTTQYAGGTLDYEYANSGTTNNHRIIVYFK